MWLGIDFGTTRTVVAAVVDGRHPVAAFDEAGEFREYVPGIAAMRAGELLVGWPAARALIDGSAEHAVRSVKRLVSTLAPDAPVPGLPGITALELTTAFLAGLRRALAERSNLELDEPLRAMVAVPANSSSAQRWLTLEAFRRAGFAPIGLLNEPTAAAVELAHRHLGELTRRSPKRYVVVYDLGGGTFDTSAVSLEGRSFDLIASEGLARLGGDDFDELILAAAGVAPGAAALERAREAKEALRATTRKLHLDLGTGEPIAIDTAELYARAQPLIDRTIEQTDLLFQRLVEHGIDPDDPRELGGIYLVGGAAAFPAVGRALRARFGKKLQLAPQPFAATAIGLAIAADPDAHVIIREAITRHFGVWREADGGVDKVFDPLLGKHDEAPVVVRRRYRPTHAIGHLRFLECGALDATGQPVQDLVPWADIYFPYDPALADRAELAAVPNERRPDLMTNEIAETYTYASDGTISVHIENVSRGYGRTYALGAQPGQMR
ncbi:MAG TPA: Hsp70 family protein [Kofleriaceae bacterium]